MTKAQKKELDEAIAQLREWLKPGDTVYTILDHVSRSGMMRAIRVVVPVGRPSESHPSLPKEWKTAIDFIHPNWAIGKALGIRHWRHNGREQDALVVGGCGMDMGFHLVYELSHTLYGSGYDCIGDNCPSNEHVNIRHRRICDCGHDAYQHHNPRGCDHDACKITVCEQVDCGCREYRQIPNVDHRGAGVRHTDGYALRHRWL